MARNLPYHYRADRFFPDPSFPLKMRVNLQGDEHPPHMHEFIELVYVSGGEAEHEVRFQPEDMDVNGGKGPSGRFSYRIVAGDIFVIAPGEVHTYRETRNLEIYNVFFMPRILGGEFRELRKLPGFLEFFLTEPLFRQETRFRHKLHLRIADRHMISHIMDEMNAELEKELEGYRMIAQSLLVELLVRLARAYNVQQNTNGDSEDMPGKHAAIHRAIAFIEDHFADSISLEEIAGYCYLSPHYFCRVFKEKTGSSPWDYLTHVRLEEGKKLLRASDLSITEIALRVGFCDSSYFAKVFKANEGCSPSQFRKNRRS